MADDALFRIQIVLPAQVARLLAEWQLKNNVASRSEAVRLLVLQALEEEEKPVSTNREGQIKARKCPTID